MRISVKQTACGLTLVVLVGLVIQLRHSHAQEDGRDAVQSQSDSVGSEVRTIAPRVMGERIASALARQVGNQARLVQSVLPTLVRGTRYDSCHQVNMVPRQGCLNVYVADAGHPHVPANNCAYAGDDVIICDEEFLSGFLARRGIMELIPASQRIESQRFFVLWLIGHEVGHAHLGHRGAHFAVETFDADVPVDVLSQEQELAADRFAAERLAPTDAALWPAIAFFHSVINGEVRRQVGVTPAGVGIHYDYTDQNFARFLSSTTHPGHLLRAMRILQVLADRTGSPGLQESIDSFVSHVRRGASSARDGQ